MGNYFPYAFEDKRYHTWNYHLKNKFGQKIFKVALDGGFDCPNRDGTVAHGGCTFCSAAGSGDFAGNRAEPIEVQFKKIKERMHENGVKVNILHTFRRLQIRMHLLKY